MRESRRNIKKNSKPIRKKKKLEFIGRFVRIVKPSCVCVQFGWDIS